MYVIFDLFRHGEDDDVLDIIKVEAFGRNTRCYHHVLCTRFERFDGILAFFLTCRRKRKLERMRAKDSLTFGTMDSYRFNAFEKQVLLNIWRDSVSGY
jgi:hypothetical protein